MLAVARSIWSAASDSAFVIAGSARAKACIADCICGPASAIRCWISRSEMRLAEFRMRRGRIVEADSLLTHAHAVQSKTQTVANWRFSCHS